MSVRFLNRFRLREKISASFAVLIALMLLNTAVVVLGTYVAAQKRSQQQTVVRFTGQIDRVRLQVADFVHTRSRASAQQVASGLAALGQDIRSSGLDQDAEPLQAMHHLLHGFGQHFQSYLVESDQAQALRSRTLMLGRRMAGHLEEAQLGHRLLSDHPTLDTLQIQVMKLLWAGQAVQTDPGEASAARVAQARQVVDDLRSINPAQRADEVMQLLVFRIQRDAADYLDALQSYQRLHQFKAQTERSLSRISAALASSGDAVSQRMGEAIRRYVTLAFGLMGLIVALTLVSAVALSRYLIQDILRPIQALVDVTRQIAQGEWRTRAEAGLDDEIGDLARSFNDMTQRLVDKHQALEQAHQELEARVQQRTQELAGVNAVLSAEIGERKQAQAQLQLAASVFTHAREGIVITDAQARIVDVNDTFSRITGYSRSEALGQNPRILKSNRQPASFYADMWQALLDVGHWDGEVWNRRRDGELYAEMLTISAVRDAQGQTQHYVALLSDITAMKEHQRQLETMAHFDALTHLPNRLLLADRLQQAMLQSQRRKNLLAVAYLDLDGFKAINDTHGHDAGDELLVALAQSMKLCLREGDTLARIGGDEFVAVLIDLVHFNDHEPLLERLLQAASGAAVVPTRNGPVALQVSASIGVTLYPHDNADADGLMRHADQAMYAAKQGGKNRFRLFDVAQHEALQVQMESLGQVHRALARGELVLFYQPKVNLQTRQVTGAEALIRWQHPQHGLLAPSAFLPMVENHPVSVEVGEWVISAALAQMQVWRDAGLTLPVSVNIGARQLQQEGLAQRLAAMLAAHPRVQAQQLQLEVLETSALEDLDRVSAVMQACRRLGVSFALDDFGTGYSSLTYLRRLPVQTLKIDQSFVRDMLEDPNDLAIVDGVIGLARAFGREVIAEGVETAAHGQRLAAMGCSLAQGFGLARPMPADQLPAWIDRWHANGAWTA